MQLGVGMLSSALTLEQTHGKAPSGLGISSGWVQAEFFPHGRYTTWGKLVGHANFWGRHCQMVQLGRGAPLV